MKKTTLLLLLLSLLACLMLTACDDAATPVQPGGSSGTAPVGGTDAPVTSSERTSELTAEPAPVTTYPVLYTRPEIAETHPDAVPVEPIEEYVKNDAYVLSLSMYDKNADFSYSELIAYLDDCLTHYSEISSYEIALVTPLEITPYFVRMAVDCVYDAKLGYDASSYTDEMTAYYKTNIPDTNKWFVGDDAIAITTTGGKYVVVLATDGMCHIGAEDVPPQILILPLTWELDMANVANADAIAKTNRPPFIGYAETYYLFGYGDVYEELMKEG